MSGKRPQNLGGEINNVVGAESDTQESLSWDGLTMVFGSTHPGGGGGNDVYVTTRMKLSGKKVQ